MFNTARIEALEVDNLDGSGPGHHGLSAAARKNAVAHTWCATMKHDVTHPTCPAGPQRRWWMKHTLWHKAPGNA